MFSINRGKLMSATLTSWSDRRVSLLCATERLKNAFSVKGEKNITAYLVIVNGSILKVKSISMISFTKNRSDAEDFYTLSFTIQEVMEEPVGNLFDPKDIGDECLLLRQFYGDAARQKKIAVVRTDFTPINLSLGMRIIYQKFTQSFDTLGEDDLLFNDFESVVLDKIYALADARPLLPRPDNTVAMAKGSDYWQKALPPPHRAGVGSEGAKAGSILPSDSRAEKGDAQSASPKLPANLEKNWWGKTAGTASPQKIEKQTVAPAPVGPPAATASVAKKALPAKVDGKQKSVPPKRVSDIMKLVKETRETRAADIREKAPTILWNSENVKSVMTGIGDLERNRLGAQYDKQNRRGNYRIYFKEFPGVGTSEAGVEFPINITNLSESGACFVVVVASKDTAPPFEINDTIMLEISIVSFFNREIFGKIVRGVRNNLSSGKVQYIYGIKFSWISAPPVFVEAVRKTQLFVAAERFTRRE